MSRLRLATRLAPVVVGIAALTVACGSSKTSATSATPPATTAAAAATSAAAPTDAATSMPDMPSMSASTDDTSSAPATGSSVAATGVTITIKNFQFSDPSGPVKAGDTVTVMNQDSVAHTYEDVNGAFDSKNIPAGGSARFVAPKAGTYQIKCDYHPSMHGTLTVS